MHARLLRRRSGPWVAVAVLWVMLAGLVGNMPAAHAVGTGRTYTDDADFDEGILVGVNHDAPNNNQLQLNVGSTTFPFIWVANSNNGTISKLDTVTGAELGRYRTAPVGSPTNPSRTTVDLDGNVWVGNRDGNTITKVGLKEAGNCIDRNGNGVIDTSTGAGDIRAWPVAGPTDECVLLHIAFPSGKGSNVRMVAIDADNNVWAGASNSTWFHHFRGSDGALLLSRQLPSGINYGGLVDPEGNLWIATFSSWKLHKYNIATDTFTTVNLPHESYGLGIDQFGNIWNSGWCHGNISKINRATATITATYPIPGGGCVRGVAVEDNGDVWVANSSTGRANHLGNDGSNKGNVITGNTPTGVAVDAAGKVWVTNYGSSNVTRIDPVTHAASNFAVGAGPYNYSDMTGIIVRNITTTVGTWTVVHDSGEAGTDWGTLSWNGSTPAGTGISGRVRAADTLAGLGAQPYVGVGNGFGFSGVTGRYIQIEMKLETTTDGVTPVLYDVDIQPQVPCPPTPTLQWNSPLSTAAVYNLSAAGTLPISFTYGSCGGFIHDESVIILIQDPAHLEYPVTAYMYGADIEIDDLAEEYRQTFYAEWYGLSAGTDLQVKVFIGDQFVGEALVHIIP
ncbi:MAG TPA: hypothetical protein VD969_04055 [Symbiobacteriaceae bacterium]|nr:hypothetical protein [Symbiobacteriaceae bacterium]